MRRVLWIIPTLSAAVLVAASGATADSAFTDPAGDGKGGPDVTAVAVTNDAAGVVTMKITTTQQADSGLLVLVDTDLNGRLDDGTGKAFMLVIPAPGIAVPMAFNIDSAGNIAPTSVPSLRVTATATELDLVFAKTDLAVNLGFNFGIAGMPPGDDSGLGDMAPDNGMWTYILTTPPPPPPPAPPAPAPAAVKPVIGAPVATMAVAGKPMTVTFPVTRSDNGAPLLKATMTCDPSVSGKALAHRESFKAGKAKLAFTVPKAAKGKLLKVKLTISSSGLAATKVATFKVR